MDALERIAAALERLAPRPVRSAHPLDHPAYRWRDGALAAVEPWRPQLVWSLFGIDRQRDALLDNLRRLARGHAAHDVLLWGSRGAGKSALVGAAVQQVGDEGLDLALVAVDDVAGLPALFALIGSQPRAFLVFLDDLSVDTARDARALRSMLEGGIESRPDNARLVATSNRRHLQPRDMADEADPVHRRDAIDDQLALADRFGLSLGFHPLNQDGYLAIVHGYAEAYGLDVDAAEAIRWAAARGGRSGRVAWQFIVEVAGRAGRAV